MTVWLRLTLVVLAVLFGACAQKPATPLATVSQVDLDRYLGTWYEIAMLPNRFQARCVGDTRGPVHERGRDDSSGQSLP